MKERSNHSLVWRENWPVSGMEFSRLLITGAHDMKEMFLQVWPGDYLYQTHLGYLLKMQISEPHPTPSELSCPGPGISIFMWIFRGGSGHEPWDSGNQMIDEHLSVDLMSHPFLLSKPKFGSGLAWEDKASWKTKVDICSIF